MMPGRIKGRSTSRRNRVLPGKLALSRARAASKPSVRASTTLPPAASKTLRQRGFVRRWRSWCRPGRRREAARESHRAKERTQMLLLPANPAWRAGGSRAKKFEPSRRPNPARLPRAAEGYVREKRKWEEKRKACKCASAEARRRKGCKGKSQQARG